MDAKLFSLHRPRQVADRLGLDESWLLRLSEELRTAEGRSNYIREFTLFDPRPGKKPRDIISVRGDLRLAQRRLHQRLLSHSIEPTPYSHGGVRGRSIKTNAGQHARNRFVYLTDIANFYPSIHSSRINDFFKSNGCLPAVARLLTSLTTLDYHLALGLITSPILAEAIIQPVDRRIAVACDRQGLVYSRYVDDICISSKHSLHGSGIDATVRTILRQSGFKVRVSKDRFIRVDEGCAVTGVRIHRGRLSVTPSYIGELETDLSSALSFARGGHHTGLFFTKEQLWGRVQFVRWINPGRAKPLIRLFRQIPWRRYRVAASQSGLIAAKAFFAERKSYVL
ncbi:reverse transcriptase family protein [Rhodopirellula islandica]|nr:reverse transcriptase family protein [Rhodopirellula islandica]